MLKIIGKNRRIWHCSGILFIMVSAVVYAGFTSELLTPEQRLGQALYFDQNLSLNRNQSCATCHDPKAGFADPRNTADPLNSPVSEGSIPGKFGDRNSPSAAYAAFSPFFHWEGTDPEEAMFVGGQFWDGRANTLAHQAAGPFLNPMEMAMPEHPYKTQVVRRLAENRDYVRAFEEVYHVHLESVNFSLTRFPLEAPGVLEVYDLMTKAIGAFEKSEMFNRFDSKFDYFLAGRVKLTSQEQRGLKLFENKGKCSLCHISTPSVAPDMSVIPPLFTDFTYDNLGLPANPKIAELRGEKMPVDKGLGGRPDIAALDPKGLQIGKFKVPTLRNIALTAPYGHNGVFATLEQIVHFYNTRDVLKTCRDISDPGFGKTCWAPPEVLQNMNTEELGNLKLKPKEEADIVAFMLTLTDGWGAGNGMAPLPRPVMPPTP